MLSVNTARCIEENSQLIEQGLNELGLPSALKSYIDGFAERSKISVTLQLNSDLGQLQKDQELCLFRVAKSV
jgi:signal transduction histidine kinase